MQISDQLDLDFHGPADAKAGADWVGVESMGILKASWSLFLPSRIDQAALAEVENWEDDVLERRSRGALGRI